jgi:nicotinate-nucleotide--dimethylbenzimidazole phosphoribosyltransferase
MSVDGWSRILVLGGIRSGKSEFAESLVRHVPTVRYVATATAGADDPEWTARIAAHRLRRPAGWTTEETGADPARLPELLRTADPTDTLLVDDLGGWVTALLDPARQTADTGAAVDELATAIRDCPARLVLVSPEVGLAVVPVTPLGRAFADTLGATNQAVARACDGVVLVVAGQPCWLRGAAQPEDLAPPRPAVPAQPAAGRGGAADGTDARPAITTPRTADTGPVIEPGMDLPLPDEDAGQAALDRLASLDLPGSGFGDLARVVAFAAATQASATPSPWRSARVLLLHGDHAGGASAGTVPGESARWAARARAGIGPLARLAAEAGATVQVVETPASRPMEEEPALARDDVEVALRRGWRLAEEAVDAGADVLVLAACGAGTDAAAAAVLAATTGAEPVAVLGRVVTSGGRVDDAAWMTRCAAVRDALHRTRRSPRGAKDILAEFGGGDVAVATGILLGAAARRTPVLLDGPVGAAAGLVSRDLAGQARHWCLLPDDGGHPAVRLAAEILDLNPLLNLRLGLGEGAAALAALPLLRSALALAATLDAEAHRGPGPDTGADDHTGPEPTPGQTEDGDRPDTADGPGSGDGDADDTGFVEPTPAGPGPTAVPEEAAIRAPGV